MHESCSDVACFVPLLETPTHTIHNYDCSWKTKETTRLLLWAHVSLFSFQFSSDLFWTRVCHLSKILAEYTKKSWICTFFIAILCIHHIFRSTFVTNMFVQKRLDWMDWSPSFFFFLWWISKFNSDNAHTWSFPWVHTIQTTRNLCWFCHVW